MAPRGLVGAALVLWGISIRLPWLGIAAGAAYEGLRLATPSPARGEALLAPVVRTTVAMVLATFAYAAATQSMPQAMYAWLRWLPMVALPLAAVQALAGSVPLSGLSRALRFAAPANAEAQGEVDLSHAHAALTLAAAGTGTGAQAWLYAGCVAVVGWALLARVPRARRAAAAALMLVAGALGFGIHAGISELQGQVEEISTELFAELLAPRPDPLRERTRIGDLGRVKLNDRIVMRVVPGAGRREPLLLREAAFDRYRGGEWQAARRASKPVAGAGDRWTLSTGPATSRLVLRRTLTGGEGLIPLPLGARSLEGLPAASVEAFPTGAVFARGTPRYVSIGVGYEPGAEEAAPDPLTDLEVPEILAATLEQVLAAESLRGPTPAATVAAVSALFESKFAYSLQLGEAGRTRTLADFLLRSRKGHCEYFATATVLLLRQAGIPARYVGGYSAQEYSPRDKAFVVRSRHAHAWAVAWLDGRWVNVDTTPARWAELEGEAARSALAPLLDTVSWLFDRAVQAWMELDAGHLQSLAGLALLAIALPLIVFRIVRRRRRRARTAARLDPVGRAWTDVEKHLAHAGHSRAPAETAMDFARRLHGMPSLPLWREQLLPLARAYYRARFDPAAEAGDAREFQLAARRFSAAARRKSIDA